MNKSKQKKNKSKPKKNSNISKQELQQAIEYYKKVLKNEKN